MGDQVVRSPWSLSRDDPHPRRGESPGAYSNSPNARADSGHIARHVGKNALDHTGKLTRRDGDLTLKHSGPDIPETE